MASSSETAEPVGEVAASSGNPTADVAVASYFSPSAENTPYRSYQWYLDGYLTPGSNVNGVNVDKISTKYSGAGIKVGIIDTGFDLSTADLAGRFDLSLELRSARLRHDQHPAGQRCGQSRHDGGGSYRREWRQRGRDRGSGRSRDAGRLLRALRIWRIDRRRTGRPARPVRSTSTSRTAAGDTTAHSPTISAIRHRRR